MPLTIKHSRGRLLMVDTPSLATTLGRNLSHALGVVHAHASHTEVQAAVGAMLPPRVLSLGPLVPGRVGPVTDPVLREVVVKRQQVGRGTRGSGVCVCVCAPVQSLVEAWQLPDAADLCSTTVNWALHV